MSPNDVLEVVARRVGESKGNPDRTGNGEVEIGQKC